MDYHPRRSGSRFPPPVENCKHNVTTFRPLPQSAIYVSNSTASVFIVVWFSILNFMQLLLKSFSMLSMFQDYDHESIIIIFISYINFTG